MLYLIAAPISPELLEQGVTAEIIHRVGAFASTTIATIGGTLVTDVNEMSLSFHKRLKADTLLIRYPLCR